jgi:hypothetical protein
LFLRPLALVDYEKSAKNFFAKSILSCYHGTLWAARTA